MSEFWAQYALREIESTYGDKCHFKPKTLHKFGRTANADQNIRTTIAEFQDDVINETFSTTNDIDSMVSTSTGDTGQTVRIEGHTIDGNNDLSFVVQDATTNGQTRVPLATPLARCSRAFLVDSDALAGNLAIYVDGALTSGKPNDDTSVRAMIRGLEGRNQTSKLATSFSSVDYFVLTYVYFGMQRSGGVAARCDIVLERKEAGTTGWKPFFESSLSIDGSSDFTKNFEPYIIIPKNNDIRGIVISTADNTAVEGGFGGFLCLVNN